MEAKMHWFGKKITCQEGFSVGEMVTTRGLFGILGASAMPNFTSAMPGLRLADAARQIATDLQQIRMKAIAQSIPYQATFSETTYLLQKCNGGCTADSGDIPLPTGITPTASAAPPFFSPRAAAAGGALTLNNRTRTK